MERKTTHFGYRTVGLAEKGRLVSGVFDSVARRYDLMNDLMSFGAHRAWKRFAAAVAGVRPGQRVLDLAGGTGDVALRVRKRLDGRGELVVADVNWAMLRRARARLLDAGVAAPGCVRCDAENLPFADDRFDCVLMAFGLRNVTRKDAAMASVHRVLKPGGRFVVLDFSKPSPALRAAYDWYSFRVIPTLGRVVAGDEDSYRYLVESIRRHPDQRELGARLARAGFVGCRCFNLTGGVAAVHRAFKV